MRERARVAEVAVAVQVKERVTTVLFLEKRASPTSETRTVVMGVLLPLRPRKIHIVRALLPLLRCGTLIYGRWKLS